MRHRASFFRTCLGLALRPGTVAAAVAIALVAAVPSTAHGSQRGCPGAPGDGLTLANISADGSRLVAVGSDGLIATSSGASRWTVRPSPSRHALRGVVWSGKRWVVVGDVGTILSSVDGRRWQAAGGAPAVGLRAIAALPGLVVAAGSGGSLVSSTNGLTWTEQASGTSEILWGGTRVGSELLISGKDATVIASRDGTTWYVRPDAPASDRRRGGAEAVSVATWVRRRPTGCRR